MGNGDSKTDIAGNILRLSYGRDNFTQKSETRSLGALLATKMSREKPNAAGAAAVAVWQLK